MDRIEKILNHNLFIEHKNKNDAAEVNRSFCLHNMEHYLDVARIGALMALDEGALIDREVIYATALLHDLGRHVQYETGEDHEIAGSKIARDILSDCDFSDEEIALISDAIASHSRSGKGKPESDALSEILYKADKLSRNCFDCKAYAECNWPEELKNKTIVF